MSYPFITDAIEPFACAEVFSPEECKEIIQIGQKDLKEALVLATNGESESHEIRECFTSFISPSGGEWIYKRLSAAAQGLNDRFFGFDLFGFAEDLQFAQYEVGGRYDTHIDCIHHGRIRKLSISVQLGEDYEGGNLVINYGQDLVMPKTTGMAIAFPSTALHSVQPVTKGTRYSLVGWITGPRFK